MKLPPGEWRKIMEEEKEKRKKQLEEERERKKQEREREKAENKAKREEERAVKKIERDKVTMKWNLIYLFNFCRYMYCWIQKWGYSFKDYRYRYNKVMWAVILTGVNILELKESNRNKKKDEQSTLCMYTHIIL